MQSYMQPSDQPAYHNKKHKAKCANNNTTTTTTTEKKLGYTKRLYSHSPPPFPFLCSQKRGKPRKKEARSKLAMEEDEKSATLAVNPSHPLPPPPPGRQLFAVELRPGETTIVSWKKLTRDAAHRPDGCGGAAQTSGHSAGAHPAPESRIAPAGTSKNVDELKDEPPANHFSAVIEKIERLYMGQQSSDEEELGNIPEDDEYDTEDSFIDDAELDEYFQVDTSETKHNGFFVNRGKLERINEPVSSAHHAPKKRRRKELRAHNELDGENLSSNVRMKEAARSPSLAGNNLLEHARNTVTSTGEDYQEIKSSANHNSHSGSVQKKYTDSCKLGYSCSELSNKDVSAYPIEAKDGKRLKASIQPEDPNNKLYVYSEAVDATYDKHQARKSQNELNGYIESSSNIRHRETYGKSELPDLNLPDNKYPMKSASLPPKEGSSARPKGTVLERAIRDLEKVVAESRPPGIELQESDAAYLNVKRRIPQDIKQKLAKVARLASSQGKITEELINRLMGILGHLVQLKTLKRHLKEMVELGLSAKQQKADRFQQVKREVVEMIKARTPLMNSKAAGQQDGSADDFQEDKGGLKAGNNMDEAMEDKICDLYELYVEGIDENRGPQSRKLYVELAELWPDGTIDSYGIKNAVNRARERKKQLYMRHKHAEKIKRRRASSSLRAETTGYARPRELPDSPRLGYSSDRPVSHPAASSQYLPASSRPSVLALHASVIDRPKVDKIKGRLGTGIDEQMRSGGGVLQKKPKRKSELDIGGISHSSTFTLQQEDNEQKFFTHSSMSQKTSPSMGRPGCEQST